MPEVRTERVIAAEPEAVWAVLSNVGAWSDWNDVIVNGRTRGEPGASIRCSVAVMGPIWFPVASKLHKWEAPKALEWGEDRGRIARIFHGFELQPIDGGTKVSHYESFEGAIGRLVYPLVNRPLTRNYARFLEALEARVLR